MQPSGNSKAATQTLHGPSFIFLFRSIPHLLPLRLPIRPHPTLLLPTLQYLQMPRFLGQIPFRFEDQA